MREIDALTITKVVKKLCTQANCHLGEDIKNCLSCAAQNEPWQPAKEILEQIIKNYNIADNENVPICQDTGVACVFIKIGQDVHINGNLNDAINEGVRQPVCPLERVCWQIPKEHRGVSIRIKFNDI